ncbi:MAG: ComEC/Rec2 family competence protein [Bacteroidales bacterium]|nr:ComEC/Rec2 family competence protein [Bacteroidales bacterium]
MGERVVIRGEVTGSPRPGKRAYTFDMKIHLLCSEDTICRTGTYLKVYLGMPADSVMPVAGETWQFSGKLVPIRNSGNPGAPDFRTIMSRKNCWYRFYVSTRPVLAISNRVMIGEERRLAPALIRRKVSDHWHGGIEEVSLLKAVCLGDRSSLTDDMRQAYVAAGGMHLLAVSGLHVGLIWWVLQYMTGWMSMVFRNEKQRTVAVVGLLWFYAFVTGFSSSVCRSVTMFSFFSASRMMGQRIHSVNGILVSAFLLVLIEPVRLMDIGFQLSYSAIIGIVTLHPLNRRVVRVKNRILRWAWEATSVSLAAQLSTAPLVIFYFHQLPLYSLITSLLAVPMLSVLIAIFVCSVPFISAGILEEFFNFMLIELALLMNRSMEHISSMPGALLDGMQLDRVSLSIWLLVLLMTMVAFHVRSRIPWYLVLFFTAGFLVWNSFSGLNRRSSSELVITHFSGGSMVIIREGAIVDHYCWYRDSTTLDYMKTYKDVTWNRRVYENHLYEVGDTVKITGRVSACMQVAEGVWLLGGYHYGGLVVTESVKEHVWRIVYGDSVSSHLGRPDFILLSGEPYVDGLLKESWMRNVELVIDGSNRSWYKERMNAEWDRIYLTDRSGAYVKRW